MNAFVLAGGQSTRMGRDKALLELDGRPLIDRMAELLRGLGLEPRIVGARGDLGQFAAVIADNLAGCGPLGGVEAGLAASDTELNLFVPVDTPRLPAAFLRWLMERAEASRAVATIPTIGGRAEPLCAVYSRLLLEGLRGALQRGRFRMMTAIGEAAEGIGERIDLFAVEAVAAAVGVGSWPAGTWSAGTWPVEPRVQEWFRNVNTPADYEWVRESGMTGAEKGHPIS